MHIPPSGGPRQVNVITNITNDGLGAGFGGSKERYSDDVKVGVSLDKVKVFVGLGQGVWKRRYGD